jgi:hypothetical protein
MENHFPKLMQILFTQSEAVIIRQCSGLENPDARLSRKTMSPTRKGNYAKTRQLVKAAI